ncbi:MAG TPA: FCD domain-containing protein [Syntrophorhabdaceae bacterium]|nr:FCD domain-containing protein [Syntrophorhabdaceae bacterium]
MDQRLDQADVFTPPVRERLIDKVASQIKDFIFSHNIKVGHRLPSERELARQFKVSRMVVSDALRSLERSGLVEIRIGSSGGAFVTYDVYLPLFQTMQDLLKGGRLGVHHFIEARKGIESVGIRLALQKATPKDIAHIRELNQKMIEDLEMGVRQKLRADNLAFHLAIVQISGNPIITLMIHSLIKLVDAIYPSISNYRKFILGQAQRHEAIIQAMEAKNIQRCEELIGLEAESMKELKRPGSGSKKHS